MFLSVNYGDTKSLDLFESEETPPPTKKGNSMKKSSRFPKATAATKKKQCKYFFWWYAPIIIFTSPVVAVDGGIHGDSPSGAVCSNVGINDATDVTSSLTVVVMVIPPVAVEEAASWTALNYQVWVICTNFIDCIDRTFDQNYDVFMSVLLFFSDTYEEKSFVTCKICFAGDVYQFKLDKVGGFFVNVFT